MTYWSLAAIFIALLLYASQKHIPIMDLWPRWLWPMSIRADSEETQDRPKNTDATQSAEDMDQLQSELEKTPKASAIEPALDVPSFSLSDDSGKAAETQGSASVVDEARSSDPAPTRPQPQPTITVPSQKAFMPAKSPSSIMPPPARPSTTASLRVPSNGLLPNRGPPVNSQQRASGGLSVNGAVSTPNSRGKVLLSPGHSPMDWAALTRKENLSGVSTFQRVTPSMLKSMTGRKGKPAWSSWQGKVYNITPYLPFHPGGEAELMKGAGRDGAKLFMEVHPWVNWHNMLESCLVGVMVPENYGMGKGEESSLEDMD